jgi:hypothetical protein
MDETVELFRPVGKYELDLIERAEFRRFPPRLYYQPIFYPVLHREYAIQIARDWNTKDKASGFEGYVTRFQVRKKFLDRYQVQQVGAAIHLEYWIPAEDLADFNDNIVGPIEVIDTFLGEPAESAS